MTNEEAIEIIECGEISNRWGKDGEEVEKMAIKALKQKPCEDAISRQAVLDATVKKNSIWNSITNSKGENLEEIISQLPPISSSEKPNNWIPVSERLPEDKTYVLTTIKVPNRIAHARSGWYESGFFHNDNGDVWKATDMEVVAWMPLPKPYKGEREDEE